MSDAISDLGQALSFPSAVFPAPPSFRFSAPDEWTTDPLTGTEGGVRLDAGPDAFSPNVVISTARITGSREAVLAAQAVSISSLDQVELLDEIDLGIAGVSWHVWEYAFRDSRVGTVVQLAATAITGATPGTHSVSFVGSVTADRATELLPTIRAILQSISLTEGPVQS